MKRSTRRILVAVVLACCALYLIAVYHFVDIMAWVITSKPEDRELPAVLFALFFIALGMACFVMAGLCIRWSRQRGG